MDHVVRHDLRPPDAVRRFVDHHLWDQPGNRALVIVRGDDLADMRETLFDIAAARRMAVLCIVIGQPPDGTTHPALVLPGVLGSAGVGTLWVSDPEGRGCGWWIDSAQPLMSAETVLRQDDRPALDLLDDCLQIPDVFDGVLDELERMADHVASPGLLAFGGRLAATDLVAARLRAVRAVTGDGDDAPERRDSGLDAIIPRADGYTAPADLDPLLTRGTELDRARRAAYEAAEDAQRFSGGTTLRLLLYGGTTWHSGIRVGHARMLVQQFHRTVGRLLSAGHRPGESLDDEARDQITAYGVAAAALTPAPDDVLIGELRAATERRLRSSSIESTQLWLRLLADAASPRGSGDFLRALAGLEPDDQPLPAFPLRPAPGWLLAVLAVAAFAAGTAGPAGLAVGVAAFLGVLLVLSRRPTPNATAGAGASAGTVLRAHLPAVVLGLVGGIAVARTVTMPFAAGVTAAVAATLTVLVVLMVWWSSAAREWATLIDADAPLRTTQQLDGLLHRVILDEWRTAPARAYLADAAVAVAVALERIAVVLKEQSAALAAGQRQDRFPGDAAPDPHLDDLLTTDLRDAVDAALAIVWDRSRYGSPAGAWDMAGEQMDEHLREYDRHLALHDVNEPPPFPRSTRSRTRAYANWGPPPQLADLLETPVDGPLVQLCRTRHTNLLSLNRIHGVRFAPASMQDNVSDELSRRGRSPLLADLRWTRSGSLAGVLRMVAPRTGVVEMAWNQEGPGFGRSGEEDDHA